MTAMSASVRVGKATASSAIVGPPQVGASAAPGLCELEQLKREGPKTGAPAGTRQSRSGGGPDQSEWGSEAGNESFSWPSRYSSRSVSTSSGSSCGCGVALTASRPLRRKSQVDALGLHLGNCPRKADAVGPPTPTQSDSLSPLLVELEVCEPESHRLEALSAARATSKFRNDSK